MPAVPRGAGCDQRHTVDLFKVGNSDFNPSTTVIRPISVMTTSPGGMAPSRVFPMYRLGIMEGGSMEL